MDPRLLRLYELELQHLREMGAEFAARFPKVAGRLGMAGGAEVTDPYVERLLEGGAFMAARVHLKLDEEFPRFCQRLMQVVQPYAVAPTPSMLIAQLRPELDNPALAAGFTVPRDTALFGASAGATDTRCEFRTGNAITLWPVEITDVSYLAHAPDLPLGQSADGRKVLSELRGVLRVRCSVAGGLPCQALPLRSLRLYFAGVGDKAFRLHELVTGATLAVAVSGTRRPLGRIDVLPGKQVEMVGFADEEALLQGGLPTFEGYRHLREYFAFAQRYLFADVNGLDRVLGHVDGDTFELNFLLGSGHADLESSVTRDSLLLHCVPAVNLFPHRADRVMVSDAVHDFHVVPDRTRPLDLEVYSIESVTGYGGSTDTRQAFRPLYSAFDDDDASPLAYYTVHREPRMLSDTSRAEGHRSAYIGTEVYLSIVDQRHAPYAPALHQLAVDTVCSNRDLPRLMRVTGADSDLLVDMAAPICGVRCVGGPSSPAPPPLDTAIGWRLISQLSLNYLSLSDAGDGQAAAALRALLALHAQPDDAVALRQIQGLVAVHSHPVVRRLPMPGPIAFGRGLEVELTVDELGFQGATPYLLGCVLDHYLARYVSINAFVHTVMRSTTRRDIMRGAPRCGKRAIC